MVKINNFLLLALMFSGSLNAGIEEFFKKAENKSAISEMRNIDFIYMINLDKRPEKWNLSLSKFDMYKIYPYRFSAVNGWELSLDIINKIGVKFAPGMQKGGDANTYSPQENFVHHWVTIGNYGQTYFARGLTRGAMGIVLSHLSVLQDAYDSGYETIWVMEDDIEIFADPRILSDLIESLDHQVDKKWDILFTDQDTWSAEGKRVPCRAIPQRPNFKVPPLKFFLAKFKTVGEFTRIGMRYGAYSMIIRRSGMKKILDYFKKYNIFNPYDIDFWLPSHIRMYCCNQDIVGTIPQALSDNGHPYYLENGHP